MFRNQYDGDNTTWSPQGRIHQVEYAMEAVKQGSAVVGLTSDTHCRFFLVVLKRSPGELASFQRKMLKIDSHMGVGFSGLASDARVLSHFMRTETMKSRMIFNRNLPISRMVTKITAKAQINTQSYEYEAISIGSRAQSAKTYLEKELGSFKTSNLDQLIVHGLRSLRDTLHQDKQLTIENCSIGVVGKDCDFTLYEGEFISRYLEILNAGDPQPPAPSDAAAMADGGSDVVMGTP